MCPSRGLFELIRFASGIFPSLCYLFNMSGSQQVGTTKQVAVNTLFSYLFSLKHRAWERQRVQQQEVTAAYGNRLYLPRVLLNPESESSFLRLFVNCISNDWPFVLGHCSEVDSQLIEKRK